MKVSSFQKCITEIHDLQFLRGWGINCFILPQFYSSRSSLQKTSVVSSCFVVSTNVETMSVLDSVKLTSSGTHPDKSCLGVFVYSLNLK